MKKLILFLVTAAILLMSCNKSLDHNACLNSVKKTFPRCAIYKDLNAEFSFILVDSVNHNVMRIKTMDLSDSNVSEAVILVKQN